jgi:uncharacterized protein (TIGR03437 family)
VKQPLTVTITDPDAVRWGFQLSARTASDNSQAGTLEPPPDEYIKVICSDSRPRGPGGCPASAPIEYIEHSTPGQTNTFRVEWLPPEADRGPVKFYIAANAANGNSSSSGDDIYTATYTLVWKPGQPTGDGPRFTSSGVVNAATFAPGISPGAFISIFGENLAPATRSWDGAIQGTALPSQLEGVSVTVGGKPAYLALVSPLQLNVLLPTGDWAGPAEVKVITAHGAASVPAVVQRHAPGFFSSPLERKYVVATHTDNALVAPARQVLGVTSRPAEPGETVALWGTGFGPTAPHVPSGQIVTDAYPLANPHDLKVTIGGKDARVSFAGVMLPGVYQLNVDIPPDLDDGDHPVLAQIGGTRTQANAFIAVQRPSQAVAIRVFYRLDPWLVYGTTGAGTWVSPPVFGPVSQGRGTFVMPARAQGFDADGQPTSLIPATWIADDPEMVRVNPTAAAEVEITVLRAGESALRVTAEGASTQLTIKSAYQSNTLMVEFAQ